MSNTSSTSNLDGLVVPRCILCGSLGRLLHRDLTDRLFGTPGRWSVCRCDGPDCGLIWPDPMPSGQDIEKAYASYYTHSSGKQASGPGFLNRLYRRLKRSYLSRRYGYAFPVPRRHLDEILSRVFWLLPLRRRSLDVGVRFLDCAPEGRLLDVGCGSGEWLVQMRELGWQVEGIDFDAEAVNSARRRGIEVALGTVQERAFQEGSFDAITLNHVLEHLADPVDTLIECARILKPGGTLFIATPCGSSLSHRVFGRNWRGLEPPRHLHVFSFPSLLRALKEAGFEEVSVRPIAASSVLAESIALCVSRDRLSVGVRPGRILRATAEVLALLELCVLPWAPTLADCVGAVAVKR